MHDSGTYVRTDMDSHYTVDAHVIRSHISIGRVSVDAFRDLSGTLPEHLEPIQMCFGTSLEPCRNLPKLAGTSEANSDAFQNLLELPGTFRNLLGTLPEPLEAVQILSGTFRNLPEPCRNLWNKFKCFPEPSGTSQNLPERLTTESGNTGTR